MKKYSDKVLDDRIHSFLNRKAEQYPELNSLWLDDSEMTKPSFSTRLLQSLTSTNRLSLN